MAQAVVGNAIIKCSFGTAPSSLNIPASKVMVSGMPAATTLTSAPNLNVQSFGLCSSQANPAVAAAMAAPPPGTVKPQPCTPMLSGGPWKGSSSKVKWAGAPALTPEGCLICTYGGNISIVSAGQAKVNV